MKTINTQEEIPNYFYIFTSRNEQAFLNKCENHNIKLRSGILMSSGFGNVICLNEEQRKKFLTGDLIYAPFIPNETTNIGNISPFMFRLIKRYNVEYNLEKFRYEYYKNYPSRFSCIYAFGSLEDCLDFSNGKKNWNLDSLKKFKLVFDDNFNKYIKVIKANFKIIGLLENYPVEILTETTQNSIYEHYWSGKKELNLPEIKIADDVIIKESKCGNIAEYLIEGILEEVTFTKEEQNQLKKLKSKSKLTKERNE